MSGKLLEKYASRGSSDGSELDGDAESGGAENLGAFGFLRGPRERSVMLELRKISGDIVAIAYSFIDRIEFDPSEGISIRCGRETIRIKGVGLNSEIRPNVRLFQAITRQRVPWIAESNQRATVQADKDSVVVETIQW
jgi:hypothetical protein